MALWTAEDRARIEGKIRAVESKTAGEIVVASVGRADSYAGIRLFYAMLLGLCGTTLLHGWDPGLPGLWLIALQLPLTAVGWALLGWPSAMRWIVPAGVRARSVHQRALRMFTERSVYATRDHSGVLILLSELEHRVVILGDRGIHERLRTQGWQRHVETIVAAIRGGRAAEGVCQVLDALQVEMAARFPQRPDDENELSDAVVDERE